MSRPLPTEAGRTYARELVGRIAQILSEYQIAAIRLDMNHFGNTYPGLSVVHFREGKLHTLADVTCDPQQGVIFSQMYANGYYPEDFTRGVKQLVHYTERLLQAGPHVLSDGTFAELEQASTEISNRYLHHLLAPSSPHNL